MRFPELKFSPFLGTRTETFPSYAFGAKKKKKGNIMTFSKMGVLQNWKMLKKGSWGAAKGA